MDNYIAKVRKKIDEKQSVINNYDITKPCRTKMDAILEVRDGNTR